MCVTPYYILTTMQQQVPYYYISAYIVMLAIMMGLIIGFPDAATLHLWLNGVHTPALDRLFCAISQVAEWPLYVVMVVVAGWRWRWTAYYLICEACSALLVQGVKYICDTPRPVAILGDNPAFSSIVVEGVELHQSLSTPSGHTASYFIFCTVLMVVLTSTTWYKHHPACAGVLSVMMVIVATLGGYSRIYLSQHFLLDVAIGSVIGVTIPLLLLPLWQRIQRINQLPRIRIR